MKPKFSNILRQLHSSLSHIIMITGCQSKKTDADIKAAVETKLKSDP